MNRDELMKTLKVAGIACDRAEDYIGDGATELDKTGVCIYLDDPDNETVNFYLYPADNGWYTENGIWICGGDVLEDGEVVGYVQKQQMEYNINFPGTRSGRNGERKMSDEPKVYKVYTTRNEGAFGFCEDSDPTDIELEHESVCLKSDVDKFIAELKEKLHDVDNQWNEQCNEIAQLKADNEQFKAKLESVQANAYADSVDAGMRERRLRRSLWLARAEMARTSAWVFWNRKDDYNYNKWKNVERKCRAKAEQYR